MYNMFIMKNSNNNIKVIKRNDKVVNFDRNKIKAAIKKASLTIYSDKKAEEISLIITKIIVNKISNLKKNKIINIELIQDEIEKALMNGGYDKIAKNYILYRENRKELRNTKYYLGIEDDLKLSINSLNVLKSRYLKRDENKNIIETPKELFQRVAGHIVKAEENYKSKYSKSQIEETFFNLMKNLDFLPNSPTLMNAKTKIGQLSACFVLPVNDSIEEIFDTLKYMAIIHKTGGGTGFNFSRLRPKDDLVNTTKGNASGPLSFMEIFDKATEVIVQGGRRRGANMGIIRCDHPDIIDFVEAKINNNKFSNFNLSVGITEKFMNAVLKNDNFDLINPKTNKKQITIKAKELFDIIASSAWHIGDPGLIFLDEINKNNPTPDLGNIEATNPCGELPLLPYESCNLGSINLSNMVYDNEINWDKLKNTINWGIRFLDNIIDVNNFPIKQIEKITKGNRKIGLGVMGFADMLIKCNIPYDSQKAVSLAETLMSFIKKESINTSLELAEERGVFPNYEKSIYKKKNLKLRNATVNTIAPTGTISIIAGCSSGIEPLFGVCYLRNIMSGTKMIELNPMFKDLLIKKNIYNKALITKIFQSGSLQNIKELTKEIKKLFVTSFDIPPKNHLLIQAAFQKHTDNSVSKTINLPKNAIIDQVKEIYLTAYKFKCKGITVYRYGSKEDQVLKFNYKGDKLSSKMDESILVDQEFAGGCLYDKCSL